MRAATVAAIVALAVLAGFPGGANPMAAETSATRGADVVLRVGVLESMATRNPLIPLAAPDPGTDDVLGIVYGSVLLPHPTSEQPMAYIAKGVDADEDGMFEPAREYDVWTEGPSAATPLVVTAYYDFNGVRWHDGAQVTVWDLLFSYHLGAMHPRFNTSLRVLFCSPTATHEACGRQLGVGTAVKNWEGEGTMTGDPALRVAVVFTLNEPFVRFAEKTLAPRLFPMHAWSRTGGGRHADLGCSIWVPPSEADAKGIPECGTTDPAKWGRGIASSEAVSGSRPFLFWGDSGALYWLVRDADVIGNGPFRFDYWNSSTGTVRLVRFDDYYTGAGRDDRLSRLLRLPAVNVIEFRRYANYLLAAAALEAGEVDILRPPIPSEFTPRITLCCPDVRYESFADPSLVYLAYNLRREPWGYRNGDASDDIGAVLRRAIAHLVDKKSMVQNLLQLFAVVAHSTVSPGNTFWHNGNILEPAYDLAQANAVLDSPEARAVGISADPPGDCSRLAPSGCRSLGTRGQSTFSIVTLNADRSPVQASAGAVIADAMRRVGINADAKLIAFGQVPAIILDPNQMVLQRDFDIFLGEARVDETDPDYHFALFHSSNAALGENAVGVRNATLDRAIEDSRRALDRGVRQAHVFDVQEVIGELRPVEILYYRTKIEGYRGDRFVNWTTHGGTIWNYWSLIGIRPGIAPAYSLAIEAPTAVLSGSVEEIVVRVRDAAGIALADASVTLHTTHGLLERGDVTGSTITARTGSTGLVAAKFRAPAVEVEMNVLLTVTATHPDFPEVVERIVSIAVFPASSQFLSLTVELPLGDVARPGDVLPMVITVRDQDRSYVVDADVVVESSNASALAPDRAEGTSGEMATLLLRADGVVNETTVRITARADKEGHEGTAASVFVVLLPERLKPCPGGRPPAPDGTCPPVDALPGPDYAPVLLGILIGTIAAGAAFAVVRRLRRR